MKRDETKRMSKWIRTSVAFGLPVFFFGCFSSPSSERDHADAGLQSQPAVTVEFAAAKLESDLA